MKNFSVLILVISFIFQTLSFSQNKVIDSLKIVLQNHKENDSIRVNLLIRLSYRYSKIDIDKADEMAQKAYDLSKQLGFIRGEAKSLTRLSYNQIKKANLDEAEALAQNALKLCESINDNDCIISSYYKLGEIALYKTDFDKATEYYQKVLEDSIKKGDSLSQADVLNNLGIISYSKGDFDKALSLYNEATNIRVKLGDEKSILSSLNNIGIICLNQGKYTEALEAFNKLLKMHREDNNKRGIARISYNISAVYYELKQYEKTLDFMNEALTRYRDLKDQRQIAACLINIGAVYADLKEFTKALDFMTESLHISNEIDDAAELSAGHFQLGDLYLLMNQPKIALKHYNTSLEFSKTIESRLYVCHTNIGLARTHVMLENYSEALVHTKEGKEIADNLELLAQQKMASELLATIYSKTGNYKKAFENYEQFKLLNDSLFNKESIEKITQLEYEYKYKQALDSASIRELKLTKTVKATSQDLEKTQRNLFLGVIGSLIIALILGGIIFFLKLRHEKAKTQNIAIEQKLLRSQMTPHFIFNSLSVLQGMILNKEEKKSIFYLSKFSKLLRITLENSRDKLVPLKEELEAINNYLELQNLEVSQAYDYTILVDQAIDELLFKIPPMLIQPFIENAIEHAFKNKIENRKIDIQLNYSNKELICTVTDNGIGIDTQNSSKRKDKKSLATTITTERLNMLSKDFNIKGSVKIEDRQKYNEQGTRVTLVIPYKIDKA